MTARPMLLHVETTTLASGGCVRMHAGQHPTAPPAGHHREHCCNPPPPPTAQSVESCVAAYAAQGGQRGHRGGLQG